MKHIGGQGKAEVGSMPKSNCYQCVGRYIVV